MSAYIRVLAHSLGYVVRVCTNYRRTQRLLSRSLILPHNALHLFHSLPVFARVQVVVCDPGDLCHLGGVSGSHFLTCGGLGSASTYHCTYNSCCENVAAHIECCSETIDEPIDSHNYGVHSGDLR